MKIIYHYKIIFIYKFGIYVLAAEIDNNNTQTIKLIEDIILGDNQVAFLSYGLINSIVKSHNQHLHKLLGDLLLLDDCKKDCANPSLKIWIMHSRSFF